jgi:hypothetical protein
MTHSIHVRGFAPTLLSLFRSLLILAVYPFSETVGVWQGAHSVWHMFSQFPEYIASIPASLRERANGSHSSWARRMSL